MKDNALFLLVAAVELWWLLVVAVRRLLVVVVLLLLLPVGGAWHNNAHHYIEQNAWEAGTEYAEECISQSNERRVEVEIFCDASAHASEHLARLRFIESFSGVSHSRIFLFGERHAPSRRLQYESLLYPLDAQTMPKFHHLRNFFQKNPPVPKIFPLFEELGDEVGELFAPPVPVVGHVVAPVVEAGVGTFLAQ